jgi:hypothetical protein
LNTIHPGAGGELVCALLASLRGHGGFREGAPNYVGQDIIESAIAAFAAEGYDLSWSGELRPMLLENLSGVALSDALQSYVRRAKRGSSDAAVLAGTSKDLLEGVAAHILQRRYGAYPQTSNFPTLLGQVFVALGLATPMEPPSPGEPANKRVDRAMYELACAINQLRNKEGIGHGRPRLPSVTPDCHREYGGNRRASLEHSSGPQIEGLFRRPAFCVSRRRKASFILANKSCAPSSDISASTIRAQRHRQQA